MKRTREDETTVDLALRDTLQRRQELHLEKT